MRIVRFGGSKMVDTIENVKGADTPRKVNALDAELAEMIERQKARIKVVASEMGKAFNI